MITFFSDPHIGVSRMANTTPTSRRHWQKLIFENAYQIADRDGPVFCGGDLFDNYTNKEHALLQGLELARKCTIILGGNHDVTQDKTQVSSLDVLAEVLGDGDPHIIRPKFNEVVVECEVFVQHRLAVTCIPHHTTQDLFDEALSAAHSYKVRDMTNVLLLHCNYESPHALTETSLNLSQEQAEELLKEFDYILLGHEHQPRDLFDGRLRIIGNTFPTSFSDISDKRILVFEGGELRSQQVWSEVDGLLEVSCDDIPEGTLPGLQFVEVTGKVEHGQLAHVARSIGRLWRANPELLAVKSSVTVTGVAEALKRGSADIRSLPQMIEEELAHDRDQLEMWHEVTR